MPRADEKPTFTRRVREFFRKHRFVVGGLVLGVGILMSLFAASDFSPLASLGPFASLNAVTDQSGHDGVNYNLVFVIAGPIIALIGAYLVGAYLVARRRFEHLMLTRSKAEFLRNLPEIEELLWDLTPADERRYLDKRADFRLR